MSSEDVNGETGSDKTQSESSTGLTWQSLFEDGMVWETQPNTKLISEENIRLVIIRSVSGQDIDCMLIECSLNLAKKAVGGFCAISYVWGNQNCDVEISVNDQPVMVTSDLRNALQAAFQWHCRPNSMAVAITEFPILWVDGLCINQVDNAEKSVQVQHMDQIYSGAERLLIWLGVEFDNSRAVICVLKWIEANRTKDFLTHKSILPP